MGLELKNLINTENMMRLTQITNKLQIKLKDEREYVTITENPIVHHLNQDDGY